MTRIVNVVETIKHLNRERVRIVHFNGPAVSMAVGFFQILHSFRIEEPELLLEIKSRISGESGASMTIDNNIDQTVIVDNGGTGASVIASDTVPSFGQTQFKYFEHQTRQTVGTTAADSSGHGGKLASMFQAWHGWAYLLEEDDILRALAILSMVQPIGISDLDAEVEIVTSVAPPLDVMQAARRRRRATNI